MGCHPYLDDVTIIGGGLGGCALALALSARGIPVIVYESRPANSDVLKSGVVLTPNGLWVLDQLGVFARVRDRCFTTTHRVFKNDKDKTLRKTLVSHEDLYGYRNHRIWRKLLLDEMKKMLHERSVVINYDSRFGGIIEDTADGVSFRVNGEQHHTSMLIGSDGIYSSVRQYIAPDVTPEYTGTLGIMSHIKRDSVAWPYEGYERNATIQGAPGAIFFLPEDPEAVDIMIGTQVRYQEQSHGDLERLQADQDRLLQFYTKRRDEHGPTARSIIDQVSRAKENLFSWPYLQMPRLPRWYSQTGRIIIVGDGAHALPPSSGQGVNQALEDGLSLTLLLTSLTSFASGSATDSDRAIHETRTQGRLLEVLSFWQQMRQRRIDAIFEWVTNSQNVERLPDEERKKLLAEGKIKAETLSGRDDMSWLYQPTLENEIQTWLRTSDRSRADGIANA